MQQQKQTVYVVNEHKGLESFSGSYLCYIWRGNQPWMTRQKSTPSIRFFKLLCLMICIILKNLKVFIYFIMICSIIEEN
jgi:hypothetical protein